MPEFGERADGNGVLTCTVSHNGAIWRVHASEDHPRKPLIEVSERYCCQQTVVQVGGEVMVGYFFGRPMTDAEQVEYEAALHAQEPEAED